MLQLIDLLERDAGGGGLNDLILSVQSASSQAEGIQNTQKLCDLSNRQQLTINGQQWACFNTGGNLSETICFIYMNNRVYTIDGSNFDLIKQVISTYQFTN